MPRIPRTTIEQWAVLRAVVEHGGFAQAAAALNRSQSSVSYALNRLQEQTGVTLIEIRGRRAVLTDVGRTLLTNAKLIIDDLDRLEERAQAIRKGEMIEISLVVDSLFPKVRLFEALSAFTHRHPHAVVHLHEVVRLTLADLRQRDFDLGLIWIEPDASGFTPVTEVLLLAVVAANHPLAACAEAPTEAELSAHSRVEIRSAHAGLEPVATDERVWRVNSIEAAIEAVRCGLCWGRLPRDLIQADLACGALRSFRPEDQWIRRVPLGLHFGRNVASPHGVVRELAKFLVGERLA